jgi:putative ABC transport system permease protein
VRLALRELIRKPWRFAVAGTALLVLTVLLLFLGALLDGLYLGSTGVLRSQSADLLTFSSDARSSLVRSRIDPELRAEVTSVDGVASVDGLGVALVGAEVPGEDDLADAAVVGYERPTGDIPAPPPPGDAYADRSLERRGVRIGDQVGLGPARYPVTVVGWVEDANFLLQGGLWVEPGTWREVLGASRPDSVLPDGTFQALAVTTAPDVDPAAVAEAIDAATGGATETLTRDDAVLALPGIREQGSTFTSIISVTLFVAGLVIALFFALLTLERIGLYAVLKAIGGSTAQIFAGVVTQAVVVAAVSFLLGAVVVYALSPVLADALPFQLVTSRTVTTFVLLLVTAVVGSAISLRRVVKVDPASAIG